MAALFGDYEVAKKSGLFDPEYYLATYPDVAERNVDPLVHYLEEGSREGRNPHRDFDTGFYLEQCNERGEAPDNPLLHYIRIGAARGFKTQRNATDLASSRAVKDSCDSAHGFSAAKRGARGSRVGSRKPPCKPSPFPLC